MDCIYFFFWLVFGLYFKIFLIKYFVSCTMNLFATRSNGSQKFPDRWIEERGTRYVVRCLRVILTLLERKCTRDPGTGTWAPTTFPVIVSNARA